MKRKLLRDLGLNKDAIEKIMTENGKDIESLKTSQKDAQSIIVDLRKQLCGSEKQLETLKKLSEDNEALKKQILFSMDVDLLEGDEITVTRRNGKKIKLTAGGEFHSIHHEFSLKRGDTE